MDFREQRAGDLERLKAEFRAVRLGRVIPLAAWWRDRPWNLVWVRWFLAYALFPFVLLRGVEHAGVGGTALGFGAYFAATWLIVLTLCMRPERVPTGLLLGVAGFSAVVGYALIAIAQRLPVISTLYEHALAPADPSHSLPARWAGFVLGVGLVEELAKALPIYLFLYRKGRAFRPSTFAYVGVVSGLALGVVEGVEYSYLNADLFGGSRDLVGPFVVVQMLRLVGLPLLHACWSAIAGYFLGLASVFRPAPRAMMGIGLALAAGLHGTYNTFSDGWLGVGVAALTLLVFVSYARTGDLISEELAREHEGVAPTTA